MFKDDYREKPRGREGGSEHILGILLYLFSDNITGKKFFWCTNSLHFYTEISGWKLHSGCDHCEMTEACNLTL